MGPLSRPKAPPTPQEWLVYDYEWFKSTIIWGYAYFEKPPYVKHHQPNALRLLSDQNATRQTEQM